jgi:hypothetical protein
MKGNVVCGNIQLSTSELKDTMRNYAFEHRVL